VLVIAILIGIGFIYGPMIFHKQISTGRKPYIGSPVLPLLHSLLQRVYGIGGLFRGPPNPGPWAVRFLLPSLFSASTRHCFRGIDCTFNINTILADVTTAYTVYIASCQNIDHRYPEEAASVVSALRGIGIVIMTIFGMW
jgi:hypothetical protein